MRSGSTLRLTMVWSDWASAVAGHDRIDRVLRLGAMRAAAVEDDVETVGGGHRHAGFQADAAQRRAGPVVQGIDLVAGEAVEKPLGHHAGSAAKALFGGLEDQDHFSGEAGPGQVLRGGEEHRGMAVMAAAVETAGDARGMGRAGGLVHRERVHVGAQADAAAGAGATDHADDSGPADAGMGLDPPGLQPVGDKGGGADFLKADLGMGVQVAAQRGQVRGAGDDFGDQVHGGGPCRKMPRERIPRGKAAQDRLIREVSGRARNAASEQRQQAITYQAGASGLPVAAISQVTMNCPKPPKTATPRA